MNYTKTTDTKKSFIVSLLSLLLCFAMLIGTTYAWFTDSVTSGNNRIVAGKLDIDLLMDKGDGAGYVSIAGGHGDIFKEADIAQNSNATLWEPGKTQFAKLAVENKGNLAVKYEAYIDVTDNGLASALECALVTAKEPISTDTYPNWAAVKSGLPAEAIHPVTAGRVEISTGVLDEIINGTQNEKDYVLLAVHMKEEAGNEYQGKDVVIDVTIVATQKDAEADSFDNQYDKNATYPIVSAKDFPKFDPKNPGTSDLTIQQAGKIKSASVPVEAASGVATTLFNKSTIDKEVTDNQDLTLTLNVTELGKKEVEEEAKTTTTVNLDINMSAILVIIAQDGTVKDTQSETVETMNGWTVINYQLEKDLENVKVTHSGHEMTPMATAEQTTGINETYGGYFYNSADGILTIRTMTFSPFDVSWEKIKKLDVRDDDGDGTAETLYGLGDFWNEKVVTIPASVTKIAQAPVNTSSFNYVEIPEAGGTFVDDYGRTCTFKSVDYYVFSIVINGEYIWSSNTFTSEKICGPACEKLIIEGDIDFGNVIDLTFGSSIKEIQMNKVSNIPAQLFEGTYSLEKVEMNSVKAIGMNAFMWCENIESINLPEGLTSIGGAAFDGTAIKEIEIPSTVTNCGTIDGYSVYGVFDGMEQLEKVTFKGSTLPSTPTRTARSGYVNIENAPISFFGVSCKNLKEIHFANGDVASQFVNRHTEVYNGYNLTGFNSLEFHSNLGHNLIIYVSDFSPSINAFWGKGYDFTEGRTLPTNQSTDVEKRNFYITEPTDKYELNTEYKVKCDGFKALNTIVFKQENPIMTFLAKIFE